MSSERIDVVRQAFEDFNAGDLDAFLAPLADAAVLVPDPSFPVGGPFRGRDEIRRFYEWLGEGLSPSSRVIFHGAEEAGDDLLFWFEWRGIGEASGIEASSYWYCLQTFHGDKAVRVQFFSDRETARAAAGLG